MLGYISLAILIIAADQLSKLWAVRTLMQVGTIPVLGKVFALTYAENTGAAFSILEGQRWFFVVLGAIVLVAIAVMWARGQFPNRLSRLAVSLLVGGVAGNLIDRARQGFVVDMFEFPFVNFAIFNVADLSLTVGVGLLIIFILTHKEEQNITDENPDSNSEN